MQYQWQHPFLRKSPHTAEVYTKEFRSAQVHCTDLDLQKSHLQIPLPSLQGSSFWKIPIKYVQTLWQYFYPRIYVARKADLQDGCIFRSVPEVSAERKIQTMHISKDVSLLRSVSSRHPEDSLMTGKYRRKFQEEAGSPYLLNSYETVHSDFRMQNWYT